MSIINFENEKDWQSRVQKSFKKSERNSLFDFSLDELHVHLSGLEDFKRRVKDSLTETQNTLVEIEQSLKCGVIGYDYLHGGAAEKTKEDLTHVSARHLKQVQQMDERLEQLLLEIDKFDEPASQCEQPRAELVESVVSQRRLSLDHAQYERMLLESEAQISELMARLDQKDEALRKQAELRQSELRISEFLKNQNTLLLMQESLRRKGAPGDDAQPRPPDENYDEQMERSFRDQLELKSRMIEQLQRENEDLALRVRQSTENLKKQQHRSLETAGLQERVRELTRLNEQLALQVEQQREPTILYCTHTSITHSLEQELAEKESHIAVLLEEISALNEDKTQLGLQLAEYAQTRQYLQKPTAQGGASQPQPPEEEIRNQQYFCSVQARSCQIF